MTLLFYLSFTSLQNEHKEALREVRRLTQGHVHTTQLYTEVAAEPTISVFRVIQNLSNSYLNELS